MKGQGFLHAIDFSHFMDTYQEWHAFCYGFLGVICPFPSRLKMGDTLKEETEAEYHYFMTGRGLGILAWIGIAKIIQVAFW